MAYLLPASAWVCGVRKGQSPLGKQRRRAWQGSVGRVADPEGSGSSILVQYSKVPSFLKECHLEYLGGYL